VKNGTVRRRVYLRSEGWYYLFVIVFVVGGAVLRNVNVLVALAGLMAAALILHWQLVVRSLSGLTVTRILPARMGVGEKLEVEVLLAHEAPRGTAWALEYHDELERVEPPEDNAVEQVRVLFPRINAGDTVVRRYECRLTRRGIYRFHNARLQSRYPLGFVEGTCVLGLADRLVVYPLMGRLSRQFSRVIEADPVGQQSTRHRRGLTEGDFYALREWRNGDSRRWVHWRTSAKLGSLAVRQFEQRRTSDLLLLLDLHQAHAATERERMNVEHAISFAATIVAHLGRQGGSHLAMVIASREVGHWAGSASLLFSQELLEHLAVCRASDHVRLADALEHMQALHRPGSKVLMVSTRSRDEAADSLDRKARDSVKWRLAEQSIWLNGSAGEFAAYYSLDEQRPE
jgi:uncharacterized protein (DUF58 family)